MSELELRRRTHKALIDENPMTITIQRVEKVAAGGGFSEVHGQRGPYTVRVFAKRSNPQPVADLAGRKQVDAGWGLLADYQADLKAGPNVKDEFDAQGLGHFLIANVHPLLYQGSVVGYQADLERVS